LIGRLHRGLCFIAILYLYAASVATASPYVTHVTWHRNGLLTWERMEYGTIRPTTLVRLSTNLAPGRSKILSAGAPGLVEIHVLCSQRDGGDVHVRVLSSRILRAPMARIVADGIGSAPLGSFEAHGIARMGYMARSAIEMLATAYTANSAGGDGMTAIGRRAGYGIVAVDPRVIPLGTRLYILGYGLAIAGDTGGDIVGRRIDLGFDSLRGAMLFGRRAVTVYPLK
jgi:3D (Asp-Asp-Asp) domain-containing protein